MSRYILRRFALMLPTLLGVTLLVFFSLRLIPGDIVERMAAEKGDTSPEAMAAVRESLGIDKPATQQYVIWMSGIVRGDFGKSYYATSESVSERLFNTLPITLELGALAVTLAIVTGVPLGILSAVKQDTAADYGGRLLSIGMLSIPTFWVATLVITFGALWFGWSPPLKHVSFFSDPLGNLAQFIIPALMLFSNASGSFMRLMRSSLLDVMRQDYIRTARSKGLAEYAVVTRHALKNSMIPVVTLLGTSLGPLIGGSVVIESIFALPGLGRLTYDSIAQRDYVQVQINVLFLALIYTSVNLLIDLSYGWLDPRIRYS